MAPSRFLLLKADIDRELGQIDSLISECKDTLSQMPEPPPRVALRGLGSVLHDFYTGVERLFERVATELDGELPGGANWHSELLGRMSEAVDSMRPRVVSPEVAARLRPYLGFRHVFRNIYGSDLRWPLLQELAEAAPDVWTALRAEVVVFQDRLKQLANDCR